MNECSTIRLATHILDCLKSGNYTVLLRLGFYEADVFYPASANLADRRQLQWAGADLGNWSAKSAEIAKGDWAFFSIFKSGWFWNRTKDINVHKFNGSTFVRVNTFTQKEKNALYDAWHNFVEPAIEAEDLKAKQFVLSQEDANSWHP